MCFQKEDKLLNKKIQGQFEYITHYKFYFKNPREFL